MYHMGQKVKQILDEKNITQVDFANQMGVTKQYISSILKKEHFPLNLINKLCDALNIDKKQLFEPCDYCGKKMSFEIDHYRPKSADDDIIIENAQLKKENEELKNKIIQLQDTIIKLSSK